MEKAPARWPKFLLLALFLACLVGGLFVVHHSNQAAIDAEWEAYRGKLAATGDPLTLIEISAQLPTIPPDMNSAIVVEGLADQLEALNNETLEWVPLFDDRLPHVEFDVGIPGIAVSPMRAFLQRHQAVVDALGPLRAMERGRQTKADYARTGRELLGAGLPPLTPWRTAAKLIHTLALSHLVDGRVAPAAAAVVMQIRLSNSLAIEPTLIAMLVRQAILHEAVSTLECTLATGELTADQLDELELLLSEAARTLSARRAMVTERACAIAILDGLAAGELKYSDVAEHSPWADGSVSHADIRAAQKVVAQRWTELLAVADDPVRSLEVAEDLDSQATGFPYTAGDQLAGMLWPAMHGMLARLNGTIARLQCARTATAAERFRQKQGRLPQTLEELVPAYLETVPKDPFDGKPIRVTTTARGITIYSIGPNRADDHGDSLTRDGRRERNVEWADDVRFRLLDLDQRKALPTNAEVPEQRRKPNPYED